MTYLSLWGGGTTTFYNAAANIWRMTLNNGSFPSVSGGSLSLVYSPNTSSPAYISISKTALYEINVVYSRVLIGSGTTSVTFFLDFHNITTNTVVGWCRLLLNNTSGPSAQTGVINVIQNLNTGNDYDVRITYADNSVFGYAD